MLDLFDLYEFLHGVSPDVSFGYFDPRADLLGREAQRAVEAEVLAVQVVVANDRLHEQCELVGLTHALREDDEWLRVDGENFSAGPVEAIIGRHPDVRSMAMYAVPDDPVGDRVMVGLELHADSVLDPAQFDAFLARQPDLGTKWRPASSVSTTNYRSSRA